MINLDELIKLKRNKCLKFKEAFYQVYKSYLQEYAFLGFTDLTWNKILMETFKNITWDNNINMILKEVEMKLSTILKENILVLIKNKNYFLISNMIICIKKEEHNPKNILNKLLIQLKKYEIEIDESYFNTLINESKKFKSLFASLGFSNMSYHEFSDILKYGELLIELSSSNLDLKKTKELFNYYESLNEEFNEAQIKLGSIKKLKLLMELKSNFDDIYEYMLKLDIKISRSDFCYYLCSLNYKKLKEILEFYKDNNYYICLLYKELKDYEKNCELYHKTESIYDYFPALEGLSEEQRRELIDSLITKLPNDTKKRIELYLSNRLSKHTKSGINIHKEIELLQKEYITICTNKGYINKKYRQKTMYDRFKDIPGINFTEKKRIINNCFKNTRKDDYELVLEYLKGKYKSASKEGIKALQIIANVKALYERKYIKPTNIKQLNNRIKTLENESEALKELVIRELLNSLEEDQKASLILYLEGKLKDHYNEKVVANCALSNLRKRYQRVIPSLLILEDILDLNISDFKHIMKNLQGKKVDYLIKLLKIIEYKYLSLGTTLNDYNCFKRLVLNEIIINNPEYDIELIILKYISYTYKDILEITATEQNTLLFYRGSHE